MKSARCHIDVVLKQKELEEENQEESGKRNAQFFPFGAAGGNPDQKIKEQGKAQNRRACFEKDGEEGCRHCAVPAFPVCEPEREHDAEGQRGFQTECDCLPVGQWFQKEGNPPSCGTECGDAARAQNGGEQGCCSRHAGKVQQMSKQVNRFRGKKRIPDGVENRQNAVRVDIGAFVAVLSGRIKFRKGEVVFCEKESLIVKSDNFVPVGRIVNQMNIAEENEKKEERE